MSWISINEELPKEEGWYLTTCYNPEFWSGNGIVRELYWYPNMKQWIDNIRRSEHFGTDIRKFYWTREVIAWKELPKPYVPKSRKEDCK